MQRLIVTAVIVALVASVALVVRRRRMADAPTQRRYTVPEQLDRDDFARPETPWLVAVFTSATCDMCQGVLERARVLESGQVAIAEIEFTANRQLHSKYDVDAVPTLVVCDASGVTRACFLGPVNATDLWAAVAEAREPGSSPEPHLGQTPERDTARDLPAHEGSIAPGRPAVGGPAASDPAAVDQTADDQTADDQTARDQIANGPSANDPTADDATAGEPT